jgi:hypothetical protein
VSGKVKAQLMEREIILILLDRDDLSSMIYVALRLCAGQCKIPVDIFDEIAVVVTNILTSPLLPAGTIAAFATTYPATEFNVEARGWFSPVGQIDR